MAADFPGCSSRPLQTQSPHSFYFFQSGSISGLYSFGFCPTPAHKDVLPSLFHFMTVRPSPMDDSGVTAHL